MLVPGGRALLVFVCAGPRPSLEATATAVTAHERWASAFAGFRPPFVHPDPDEWAELARQSGFTVDHLDISPEMRKNIGLTSYAGGHMMYHYKPALEQLHKDVTTFVSNATNK